MILPKMPNYELTYLYRDTAFEKLSGEDASLVYAYGSQNGSAPVWVAVEVAKSIAPLHRWETCLVSFPMSHGNEPTVKSLDLRDVKTQENPPIVARFFAFQYKDTNQIQVVLYWYQTARFSLNGTMQTMNLKMSLVEYPSSTEDIPAVEAQMLAFALAINAYWQPIQTWTLVTLIISQNGLVLSGITAVILVAIVGYAFFLDWRSKRSLMQLYGKISAQDQLLLTAVANAQKLHNSSTQKVTVEYGKLTGNADEYWVKQKLDEAEKSGLIKKAIVNVQDMPVVYWRSQLSKRRLLKRISF